MNSSNVQPPAQNKRFLITGVNSGLGRAFAQGALAAGYRVVGTVRREEDRGAFEATYPGRARAVVLDVSDFEAVSPAVEKIEREFGPIDVLVNNAGYGHEGTLEESPLDDRAFGRADTASLCLPIRPLRPIHPPAGVISPRNN